MAPGSRIAALRQSLLQDVRPGMEVDVAKLSTVLRGYFRDPRYFGEEAGDPHVRQLSSGPTYALTFSDPACRRLVVRFHESAAHEFRLLTAMRKLTARRQLSVPVAQPHRRPLAQVVGALVVGVNLHGSVL